MIDDLIVTRFPSAAALRDNAAVVADLLYDAIELFAIRTGIRTTRYADAYPLAAEMTIGSFAKPHLSGICRFEQLPVEAALRWVKSRLLSNLKTVLTNPKSKYWLGHADREQAAAEHVMFGNVNQIKQFEIESDLGRIARDEMEKGLNLVWAEALTDHEFDWLDFVDLCEKYGFDANEISKSKSKGEIDISGFAQLVLDFEDFEEVL